MEIKGKNLPNLKVYIFTLAAAIFLYGCTQPRNDYKYICFNPIKGWEKEVPIIFNLDLTDTVNIQEIYFTAKIKHNENLNNINGFPIEVCFKSPKGNNYYSMVSLPINVIQKNEIYRLSQGVIEIEWPFIKNIKNKESGIWQLTIKQTGVADTYKNIIGFGACCKENK